MMKSVLSLLIIISTVLNICKSNCYMGVYENGVSSTDKKTILNKHNEFRIMVAGGQVPNQPRGINLKRLKWDSNLAAAAQNIANSCEFKHVSVNSDRWSAVGQNLYISMSTAYDDKGADWNSAIQSWFNEYKIYDYPHGSSGTGHYTQVVWANTQYVGCGYSYYPTNESFKYRKLYVCNYGPAGNYVGQAPYETGDSGCENLC